MCFFEEKDQNANTFIETLLPWQNLRSVVLSYDGCISNTAEQKMLPKLTCQTENILSLRDFTDICFI